MNNEEKILEMLRLMNDKFDSLEQSVNLLTLQINRLDQRVNSIERDVAEIKMRTENVEKDVRTTKIKVEELEEDHLEIMPQIDNIHKILNNVFDDIARHDTRLARHDRIIG